jgi:hypothetical protein
MYPDGANFNELYVMNNRPVTCPVCGARTHFSEIKDGLDVSQHHVCLNADCLGEFVTIKEDPPAVQLGS